MDSPAPAPVEAPDDPASDAVTAETPAAPAEPRPSRFETITAALSAFLVYLGITVLLTAETWVDPANRWPGNCCDQQQFQWMLAWMPTAISHGLNPLYTTQMAAPDGVNLMWNASIPLVALVLSPVTVAFGPIVAYNVALVGALVSSAMAAWFAARWIVGGLLGPLVAGAVYAFGAYSIGHAWIHLNLTVACIPPLMLVLLYELLVLRRYRPSRLGIGIGLLAAAQFLVFEEVLATMAIAATVFAVILAIAVHDVRAIREGFARILRAAVPAALTFGIVGAFPLFWQFAGPRRISGAVQDTTTFSTDLLNLVLPTPHTWLSPEPLHEITGRFSGLFHEGTAYIGIPLLLVLVVLVVTRWSDLRVRVAGLSALVIFVLTLGPQLTVGTLKTGIPMPWWPFAHLPLIEHALPGRVTMYMFLAVAMLVALAIHYLRRMRPAPQLLGLAFLALALVVAAPKQLGTWKSETPEFFRNGGAASLGPDELVLFAPHFANGAGAAPMQWTAVAGNEPRMWQGYAYVPREDGAPGFGPPGNTLTQLMSEIQDNGTPLLARGQQRDEALAALRDNGITHVVVGPLQYRDQMLAFLEDLLGSPPREVDGVQLWDLRALGISGAATP